MIAVLLSDDGNIFKVFNPKTKEDLTDQYELNMLVIKTKDGKYKAGFHVGQDCTVKIEEATAAAEAAAKGELEGKSEAEEFFIGDPASSAPKDGGRYNRG